MVIQWEKGSFPTNRARDFKDIHIEKKYALILKNKSYSKCIIGIHIKDKISKLLEENL